MDDPMNVRPHDAAFYEQCEALANAAADQLGALVMFVACQEGGKMYIGTSKPKVMGPELQQIAELAETDAPGFLVGLARATYVQNEIAKYATGQ